MAVHRQKQCTTSNASDSTPVQPSQQMPDQQEFRLHLGATEQTDGQDPAGRLAHIRDHPKVALHFEGSGGDYIIITGEAAVSADDPPADQVPAWVEKYQAFYPQFLGMTVKQAASATIPLRIRPLTLRYVANPRGKPGEQAV